MSEYSEKFKDPRWQKKRLQILKRDKWTCKKCGDDEKTLHVHHKEYIYGNDPWDYNNSMLVTLCEDCHKVIEKLKQDKEFKGAKFNDINIYKSKDWSSDVIIMFSSIKRICSMEIYNKKREFVIGFNFDYDELMNIIKILRKAVNA